MISSALMQYTSTAMAMPFEVGKTLLQVQWSPREGVREEGMQYPVDDGRDKDFGGEEDEVGAFR